jgi:uncharacterized protein YcbX
MTKIGTIESVWRYPVKSMGGEQVDDVFAAFAGLMGDRIYGISSSAAPIAAFPWHTSREQEKLVLYKPRFKRHGETLKPATLERALEELLNPLYPLADAFAVEVETPDGEVFDIDDPAFLGSLRGETNGDLTLHYSQKNLVDSRPLSLFSLQTVAQLSEETDMALDKRRFRANFYVDWDSGGGFYEDELVDRKLKIGDSLEVIILRRDPRCKVITIDPDTAETSHKVLSKVARNHDGCAGVFAGVLSEGTVSSGDAIVLID